MFRQSAKEMFRQSARNISPCSMTSVTLGWCWYLLQRGRRQRRLRRDGHAEKAGAAVPRVLERRNGEEPEQEGKEQVGERAADGVIYTVKTELYYIPDIPLPSSADRPPPDSSTTTRGRAAPGRGPTPPRPPRCQRAPRPRRPRPWGDSWEEGDCCRRTPPRPPSTARESGSFEQRRNEWNRPRARSRDQSEGIRIKVKGPKNTFAESERGSWRRYTGVRGS